MKVGVVIQARMSSARLPGKVLRSLVGRPVLQYLLDGLAQSRRGFPICVATSTAPSDDALAEFCSARGIACVRGSLEDVAGRCLRAAVVHGWDRFVRLCADSPVLDYRLVDRALGLAEASDFDLVTNVLRRTYPRGQSVEVVATSTFARVCQQMTSARDREHVTTCFYDDTRPFRIAAFESERDASEVSLALDTPEDERRLSLLLSDMSRPHWEYGVDEIVGMYRRRFESYGRVAA